MTRSGNGVETKRDELSDLGAYPWRVFQNKVRLATWLGIGVYLIASLLYLVLGQVNGDEGWYLYASRLILQGQLPYQDFAYTQMPLMPYVYAVFQSLIPGIATGRLTSILISLGTVWMGIVIARRYAGTRAGAIAAWLFAAFTFGVYFNSIVKTYALVAFFFTATLFVLSLHWRDEVKYPLAVVYAVAALLVRVTSLFFLAPILVYTLLTAKRWRTRLVILVECGCLGGLGGYLLFSDEKAAQWGILGSHLQHWADASVSSQIMVILSERLPDVVQNFGVVLALFGGAGYFLLRSKGFRSWLKEYPPIWITLAGLGLFAASHLVNGLWVVEYLVPAVTVFIPILAIVLSQVYTAVEKRSQVLVQGLLVTALLLGVLVESIQHIDLTGRRLPLAEIQSVAAVIQAHSQPQDPILALETLGAVVEADRDTLPGLALAQFSVQKLDTPTAQRLHVVNPAMLAEAVNQQAAPVVILTDGDWLRLRSIDLPSANAFERALNEHYDLAWSMPRFGQFVSVVSIYVRR